MTDYGRGKKAPVGKITAAAIGIVAVFWLVFLSPGSASDPAPVRRVVVPAPPPPVSGYDTLGAGETLAELLTDNGLDGPGVYAITQVVSEVKNPRSLRSGLIAEFSGPPGASPDHLLLQLSNAVGNDLKVHRHLCLLSLVVGWYSSIYAFILFQFFLYYT